MPRPTFGTLLALQLITSVMALFTGPAAWADGSNPVGFTINNTLPTTNHQVDPVYCNGYVYVVGGYNGVAFDTVYFAPVNDDGSLGAWAATTPIPEVAQGPGVTVWRGSLYVAPYSGNIYRATPNPDGTVAAWTSETPAGSGRGGRMSLKANDAHLYIFGGWDGGFYSDVFVASINADSSLGTWAATTSLPGNRQHTSVHFIDGRVYIAGGISCNSCVLDSVHSSPVNSDGTIGAWRVETSLPHLLWYHHSVEIGGAIFTFGGRLSIDGSLPNLNIYRAIINPSDGSISAWDTMGTMPSNYTQGPGAVYIPLRGGLTYLFGGSWSSVGTTSEVWRTGSTCPSDHDGNGTIGIDDFLAVLASWGVCP